MAAVPRDVDTVVFPNYESMPERDDVEDPFTEVRVTSMLTIWCLGDARNAQATLQIHFEPAECLPSRRDPQLDQERA
jgi:hypothetical protein